jgi:murein DD-endopeptidase MepM/ murein hydrolase activator NlpD
METTKRAARRIMGRYLLRFIKKTVVVLSPWLLVCFFVFLVVLSLFGALPEKADPGRAKVKEFVSKQEISVVSKYGQEQEFVLPWGLVYAVLGFADGWPREPDMTRAKRVYENLKPLFSYEDYDEKFVTTYYETGEDGNVYSYTVTTWVRVKLLVKVSAYEGIHLFHFEEVTEIEGDTEHTYMKPAGREFLRDYARLDACLAAELRRKGNIETVLLAGGDMAWPVPSSHVITSPFGMRRHPITGKFSFHTGIDISAAPGAEIISAADGIVRGTGDDSVYGLWILLDHGMGWATFYAHCSVLLVYPGDVTSKGQKIAEAGSTGMSTGPHLHFEVRQKGEFINPLGGVELPEGVMVPVQDNLDRRLVLEAGKAFMKGEASLEWLKEKL